MRARHHTKGPAWAVNLSPALPVAAPVQTFALELPKDQKYALVYLRRSGPDSAAAQVIRKLDAEKVTFPPTWYPLRQEGYVTFESNVRQGIRPGHRLTPKGLATANDIIKDFCFQYSIHVFAISGGRGSGGGTWSRCSCGTWSTGPHNNDHYGEGRLHTAQNAHIKDVTNGVWPTRTLTEFLNKVDPPKFDFNAGGPDPGAVRAAPGSSAEASP
jgi:hypothetical protein